MKIPDFELERFFATHEFDARHVLAASDVEGMRMSEVLELADDESRRLWDNLTLGYTQSAGLPLLREEIAKMYPGLGPDDILTFAGAEEGIFAAMHVALEPGDHVVVVLPAYQSLHEVARAVGAEVTGVRLNPRDWSLDLGLLRDSLRPKTRMVVVNFPHSPTGAQLSRAQLDEIVGMCRARGIMLFSDEVYRLLEHDPHDVLPPVASAYEKGVSLGVMSKSFALAGLRVGWIASRDRALLARLSAFKDYTTICSSAPSELLALMALRAGERVLARSAEIVRGNLPALHAFMERHAGNLSWVPPRAGSVCFPRFTSDVDTERVAVDLVTRVGVLILPGTRFQFDRAHFRIGYGRHDTAEALALIDPLIEAAATIR